MTNPTFVVGTVREDMACRVQEIDEIWVKCTNNINDPDLPYLLESCAVAIKRNVTTIREMKMFIEEQQRIHDQQRFQEVGPDEEDEEVEVDGDEEEDEEAEDEAPNAPKPDDSE